MAEKKARGKGRRRLNECVNHILPQEEEGGGEEEGEEATSVKMQRKKIRVRLVLSIFLSLSDKVVSFAPHS